MASIAEITRRLTDILCAFDHFLDSTISIGVTLSSSVESSGGVGVDGSFFSSFGFSSGFISIPLFYAV